MAENLSLPLSAQGLCRNELQSELLDRGSPIVPECCIQLVTGRLLGCWYQNGTGTQSVLVCLYRNGTVPVEV